MHARYWEEALYLLGLRAANAPKPCPCSKEATQFAGCRWPPQPSRCCEELVRPASDSPKGGRAGAGALAQRAGVVQHQRIPITNTPRAVGLNVDEAPGQVVSRIALGVFARFCRV